MKKTRFLLLLAAVFTLSMVYTSCDDLLDKDSDEKKGAAEASSSAYLPIDYANKKVAAWYLHTEEGDNKTKIEAVFLFTDSSLVVTKAKIYSQSDGRKPEYGINAVGRYVITEGDYTNGKAAVGAVAPDGEVISFVVRIEDGKMYVPMGEDGEDIIFTLMSNSLLPEAYDPSKDNQGGDQGDGLEAFFPKGYEGKTVKAWFTSSDSFSEQGYEFKALTAVYFFTDNSYVATVSMITSDQAGKHYMREIAGEGGYRITKGDFTNGTVVLTYVDEEDDLTVETSIEIKNGQFKIVTTEEGDDGEVFTYEEVYVKQDNSKVPQASDPTDNNNPQGGDGDQGSDVPAFFPKAFADKTVVAWYSWSESLSVQTMVEAVFLFDDNTLVFTEHKVFPKEIQENPERYIVATGTYTLTGTYENGTVTVILDEDRKITMTIEGGKLSIEYSSSMVYTKRNNNDVPQPLDPTDGNNPGGDDGGDDEGGDEGGDSNLAAWYMATRTMDDVEYEVAAILFADNTIVFTRTRVPDKSGSTYQTEIMGKGKYSILSGDLINGSIVIYMFEQESYLSIVDGVITSEEVNYIKQDNSKYTGPTDFDDYNGDDNGGDNGGENGDDDGDDDIDYTLAKAYLPSDYSIDNIAAWYMLADEEENSIRIEAVFLFADNTLVVTKTKIYAKSDGRDPKYEVNATGQYRITEGDYTTGKASVITADGASFDVEIVEGILTAMGANFTQMPLNYLSDLTTNGK